MKALVTDLTRIGRFTPVAPYQRFAYLCGAVLVLSGVVHGVVFLLDGGPWEGPVSWRKPILFGLSFGISLVALTWILGFLRPRKAAGWIVLGALAVASAGEVFLVSMQKWRGVESHFNEDTAFDGMVFSMMGLLVSLIVVMTVVITVWSFVRLDAPASLAFAIRSGLILMLVGQMVGVQMIIEEGNTFGAAGALKLPHAVALHGVEVLPALALVLLLSETVERHRVRVVALGTVGYTALVASTMVQTYGGRGPLDPDVFTTALALAGLTLLVVSALLALRAFGPRLHGSTGSSARGA